MGAVKSASARARTREWAAGATLAITAAWVTFGVLWWRAQHGLGEIAYDFYNLFYPNAVYATQSVLAGGRGLLWTPYQACGIPFLANTEVGLFYPLHVVFAILPREAALLASVLLHLAITGAGVFLLCRALRLGVSASLCGALAFQLGWYTVQFTGWGPIHLATYAWMSVAAWRAERLVRRSTLASAVGLALVLTVQLCAGFVQISYFTYLLVALRIAWAVATRERERPVALLAHAALALVLPLALAAVLLVPAFEMARQSIRDLPLAANEIGPGFSWKLLAATLWSQVKLPFNVLVTLLVALALVSVGRARRPDVVVFQALVIAACLVLSLGPGSGVWELYAHLPLAASFRGAGRLLWIAQLAGAVLVAFGVEALTSLLGRGAWTFPVMMLANGLVFGAVPFFGYRTGDVYDRTAGAFAFVRERATPQDRVHVVGRSRDLSLGPKAPTWFRVPGIYDYEALAPRRYAEYFAYLRTGHALRNVSEWQWILDQPLPPTLQRPLFDRTAARYLLIDRDVDRIPEVVGKGTRLLAEIDGVRIYENTQALPRARVVPSAIFVGDEAALGALASGTYDPARVVLLDRVPPPEIAVGSLGGTATIVRDEPERLIVRVRAPTASYLVVADVFYPGWTATVNGAVREILRADYTFRAVPVPSGDSEVVLAYAPASVRLGALVTAAAVAIVLAVPFAGRRAVRSPG